MDTILNTMEETQQFFIIEAEEVPQQVSQHDKKVSLWVSEQEFIRPSTNTIIHAKLEPGMYVVDVSREMGIFCKKIEAYSDELFLFSNSVIIDLISEINTFWSKANLYKENKLVHKRGILLEGFPGTGKTSIISLLSQEIIDKGGIVFKVTGPKNLLYYVPFIRDSFRKIQPDTPIITIIEDIDEYDDYSSELLDFLDGKNHINHHVVIATTNNTEDIDDTLLRPSRIDLRIEVELPSKKVRTEYFKFKKVPDEKIKELVNKSTEFSLADLKELYICVFLLDYTMDSAVEKISVIKEKKNYLEKDSKNISLSI